MRSQRVFNSKTALTLLSVGAVLLSACSKRHHSQKIEDAIAALQAEVPAETANPSNILSFQDEPQSQEASQDPEAVSPATSEFFNRARTLVAPLQKAQQEFNHFKKIDPTQSSLRVSYDDQALDHLLDLSREIKTEADLLAPKLSLLIQETSPALERESNKNLAFRTYLLRTLRLVDHTTERHRVLSELDALFPGATLVAPILFPFSASSLIPALGAEYGPVGQNAPTRYALAAWSNYFGDPAGLQSKFDFYRSQRDRDNPTIPASEETLENSPLPIAFLDSGVDFVKVPMIAPFLGRSFDYADNDTNPWLPAISTHDDLFSHGTGTVASLLSVIAKASPDTLREHKVEVRVWKTQTLRQLLSRFGGSNGLRRDDPSWENRPSVHDSIVSEILSPQSSHAPKVLVTSMSISLRTRMLSLNYPENFLSQAPWLWVMAAGNSGADARMAAPSPCLLDLPESYRPFERLICVGAARKGTSGPEIAEYSNTGPAVDLYAYESYSSFCPGSTSCATPAIGAAAALLMTEFPSLTLEDIREVLIRSAVLVTNSDGRTFRFFDPETMMPRAQKFARDLE